MPVSRLVVPLSSRRRQRNHNSANGPLGRVAAARGGVPAPLRRDVRRYAIWLLRGRSPRSRFSPKRSEGRSILEEGCRYPSRPSDREERFCAVAVFLRPVVLGAALVGLRESLFGVGELLFQGAGVEILGRD